MADRTTSQRLSQRLRSEAGVSLIHVAIASFVIMGFSAFVIDHGVLMLARAQAQNVADMAALAGATTRAMDETGNAAPPANSMTQLAINRAVDAHVIFGDTPANTGRLWSYDCPPGVIGWCVKVDVFRDGVTAGSATLPTYFGPLFGLNTQKVRATATAVAASANGTSCMKPFLVPDKWDERSVPPNDVFNPGVDVYTPYNYATNTPGTGYTLADIGRAITLFPSTPNSAISPSDFFLIAFSGPELENAIRRCDPRLQKNIGDIVDSEPGGNIGKVRSGVQLLLQDAGGPVDVVIGMFSPVEFSNLANPHGNFQLTIVNMMSVRVSTAPQPGNNKGVEGVITGGVGDNQGPAVAPGGQASLIKQIQLVR